jgi:hypothetical protein
MSRRTPVKRARRRNLQNRCEEWDSWPGVETTAASGVTTSSGLKLENMRDCCRWNSLWQSWSVLSAFRATELPTAPTISKIGTADSLDGPGVDASKWTGKMRGLCLHS